MPDEWWGSSHGILSTTPTRAGLASDGGYATPGPRPLTTAPSFHAFCTPDVLSKLQFPLGYVLSHLWAFTLSLPIPSTVPGA